MDLTELIKPQWVFRSENNGEWDVFSYSIKAAAAMEKHFKDESPNAIEAIRELMGIILSKHLEDQEGEDKSSKPTEAEISAFTEDDVNQFSREFVYNDKSFEPNVEIKKRRRSTRCGTLAQHS
ncbi:hypothetical protein [Chachezhania sediminis]|uniref:hypothetical protein n=1 Tax=Chachezhania sediminis TaxID=2599291 RepID=UPI00131CCA05|nr:hypothetical protein [Chachezhania sediminis]